MLDNINEKNAMEQIFKSIISIGDEAIKNLNSIADNAVEFSEQKLISYIQSNKDTDYGKKYNFADIHSYEDYKANVPLSVYADYKEYIDTIYETGKENVISSEPITIFTMTSGTTSAPKFIPETQECVDLSSIYTLPSVFARINQAFIEKGESGLPVGKGIFMVEISDAGKSPSGIPIGTISGLSVKANNSVFDSIITTPRELITHKDYIDTKYVQLLFGLQNKDLTWIGSCYITPVATMFDCMFDRWQDLCDDIETGTIHEDVKMSEETRKSLEAKLKPNPLRAEELRKIFALGFDKPITPLIWPKLSFITAIGTGSFKIHADRVRSYVGEDVVMNNVVISSSESIMALCTGCDTDTFVLLPQAAFFEFIPYESGDINDIKSIKDLDIGKLYEVVITTLSGFYRYRIFDVFEVVDFFGQIPVIRFSHRNNVYLNIAGEKTTEADLVRAIDNFSKETGITVNEFAVCPDYSVEPGSYHMFIETNEVIDKSKMPDYIKILNDSLRITMGYRLEQDGGSILMPKLSIQQAQTHALYRELQIMKGKSANQLKPVRILDTEEKKAFFMKMVE